MILDTVKRREIMIKYLRMKVDEEDWHGVADAAMDLREIEIEIKCYKTDEKEKK